MRPLEDRSGTDSEVQLALIAAVVAALAGRDALAGDTGRASGPIWPEACFQIDPCGFLIGEHLEQLQRADCALAHGTNGR